jgi:hypothetical protein
MREKRYVYKTSVEKPEEKRLFEGPRCRCEEIIKMYLKEFEILARVFTKYKTTYQVHNRRVVCRIPEQLSAFQCEI